MQSYTSLLSISARAVNLSLDARKKIKVVINAGGARKLRALEVDSRVPNAAALSPLLVPFSAGKGTCARLAAGAAIFAEVVMAVWGRVSYDHERKDETEERRSYHILQRSVGKSSSMARCSFTLWENYLGQRI